jgi:Zn-dependent M28 family amino/carboxypeptidase
MKRHLFHLILLLIFTSCVGQKTDVLVEKYMGTITASDLKKHLLVIASDEMEGRETGSKGQKKAGEYLVSQYKANNVPFPKGAKDYYQRIPAAFLNAVYDEKLPDSENIWAFIEGSEKPEEILVVSAHYDHIGIEKGVINNGADDDGSGTVALLEMAQAFAQAQKEGHGPKRSILFLHVTGEEHGLHGSRYYSQHPLFPLKKTIADINIDMIGRRDTIHKHTSDYIYVIGSGRLSSDLYNAVEEANKCCIKIHLDYKFDDRDDPERFYERSDHYNFARNGIPSVFLFSGIHEDYHKPGDKVEKIEFDALQKRTRLAFVLAWKLANAEQRPKVDREGK